MPRKSCPAPRKDLEAMRVQAIRARKGGMTVEGIAKMLGVHRGSVSRWLTTYSRSGATGLRAKKASGRPRKMACADLAPQLVKIVKSSPLRYGFENALWNCERIRQAIAIETGIGLSKMTVWRSMRDIGFSCQKPERRAFEQDPVARRNWLDIEWPKIRSQAKKERAVIFFEDESTVRLTPNMGKTWARVGHTPIVRGTGARASIGVMSAVSVSGRLVFKVPKRNVNGDEFILFLKQIMTNAPRKRVYVIADRGPAHVSKKVQSFVDREERLRLIFLPAYSPELNPDEYAWARLKRVELNAHREVTQAGLRQKTIGAMRRMQAKKEIIRGFVRRVYVT